MRYRNIRSPGSTHWGCHSTTPAVWLTPERRSNGLSKQSRFALFGFASPFQPGRTVQCYVRMASAYMVFDRLVGYWLKVG